MYPGTIFSKLSTPLKWYSLVRLTWSDWSAKSARSVENHSNARLTVLILTNANILKSDLFHGLNSRFKCVHKTKTSMGSNLTLKRTSFNWTFTFSLGLDFNCCS